MKKYFISSFLLLIAFSCKEKIAKKSLNKNIEKITTEINFDKLVSNYSQWWTYYNYNIDLESEFTGFDENEKVVSKKDFLEILLSGHYIPLKLDSEKSQNEYQLYKIDESVYKDISNTIKSVAKTNLRYFNMEGKQFQPFDFVDINGINYSSKNTAGKTVIIKTWFINCQACVAEFNELNELVDKYKDDKSIVFISLALDSKTKLKKFLKKRNFKYAVVAGQEDYIYNKLDFQIFPTHIIIDKEGYILKVVNNATKMISFLEQNISNQKRLAPPSPN